MPGWPLKLVALVAALGGVAHADPGVRKLVVTPPEQLTHAAPAAAISPYLYLNRCIGGCTVIGGGTNDASSNKTTLLAAGTYTLGEFANAFGQTTTTATKGTCLNPDGSVTMTTCTDDTGCASFGAGAICDTADYEWNLVVQCAKEVYSPYALTVTDTRPTGVTYSMQMVAGLGMSVGQPDGVVGIAPLASDCSAQNNVISFAFSNDHPMIQRVNEICWTVAQESAHTFGLDHEYEYLDGTSACNDPMTYRRDCGGEKFFRNRDARCGGPDDGLGPAPRACKCGGTQNSHQKLLKLLGPGESVIPPPTVAITFPTSPSVQNNWNTVANAGSRRGVDSVELWLNNYRWSGHSGAMFESLGQPNPSIYSLVAPNGVPNGGIKIIVRAFDDLGFEGDASMLVQKGASCTDDSTCAVGQKCNTGAETDTVAAGGCFWDPPVGVLGDSCEYPQYCQSDVCVGPQNQQICTKSCNPQVASGDGSCPSDYECDTASDGKSYCFPPVAAAAALRPVRCGRTQHLPCSCS